MTCRFCKTASATHRVVRGKGGRRWAKASQKPNLCRKCALQAASVINKTNGIATRLDWI